MNIKVKITPEVVAEHGLSEEEYTSNTGPSRKRT